MEIFKVSEALVAIKRIQEFMVIDETSVGDPTPMDPDYAGKKVERPRTVSEDMTSYGFPQYIKISRGIAKYGTDICLENINLEVSLISTSVKLIL